MAEKNVSGRISRRDALRIAGATLGGALLAGTGLNALGIVNFTGPRSAEANGFGNAPQLGSNIVGPDINNAEAVRPSLNQEQKEILPPQWAESAKDAATLFGGKPEYWRRDLYINETGQTQWDGVWVMEAFKLKVNFDPNGNYVGADGKPLSQEQIYDFSQLIEKVDVNFGPYAQDYRAHGTAWDGKSYWAGYGSAEFNDVEQAVIRPIVIDCLPGDAKKVYEDEAWKRTAQEFSKFLFFDKNADKIIAGLWSQEKKQFKLVQGRGWF